jgi:hypothetical protein
VSLVVGLAVTLAALSSQRPTDPERPPVVTNHQIVINGRPLAYTAEVDASPFEMSNR